MGKIYCISGLGADQRIFQKLRIPGHELVPLNWVPYDKHDDVSCYAQKLAAHIDDKEPVVLGVSFGGMLAVEIAKQQPTKKVFIVSSAKSKDELGHPGNFLKFIIRSKIIPDSLITSPNKFVLDFFGAQTIDEKEMMKDIIRRSDADFMKWALKALLSWENTTRPPGLTHIHGTADRIIPAANVHPDFWIDGGTHIMVYNRADEVSKIITDRMQGHD